MNSQDVFDIISQDKTVMLGFRGILPADYIPKILQTGQSVICNASDSSEAGTHWLCLHKNSDTTLEMFDSLGRSPRAYNLDDKLPHAEFYTYNDKQLQGNSDVCAVYCMYYLFYKSRHFPMSKIVNDLFSMDYNQNDQYLIDSIKTLYSNI